jgi:hypothetical protein
MVNLIVSIQEINCELVKQDEFDKQGMALLGLKENGDTKP